MYVRKDTVLVRPQQGLTINNLCKPKKFQNQSISEQKLYKLSREYIKITKKSINKEILILPQEEKSH